MIEGNTALLIGGVLVVFIIVLVSRLKRAERNVSKAINLIEMFFHDD